MSWKIVTENHIHSTCFAGSSRFATSSPINLLSDVSGEVELRNELESYHTSQLGINSSRKVYIKFA